jgi:hypothetical protein
MQSTFGEPSSDALQRHWASLGLDVIYLCQRGTRGRAAHYPLCAKTGSTLQPGLASPLREYWAGFDATPDVCSDGAPNRTLNFEESPASAQTAEANFISSLQIAFLSKHPELTVSVEAQFIQTIIWKPRPAGSNWQSPRHIKAQMVYDGTSGHAQAFAFSSDSPIIERYTKSPHVLLELLDTLISAVTCPGVDNSTFRFDKVLSRPKFMSVVRTESAGICRSLNCEGLVFQQSQCTSCKGAEDSMTQALSHSQNPSVERSSVHSRTRWDYLSEEEKRNRWLATKSEVDKWKHLYSNQERLIQEQIPATEQNEGSDLYSKLRKADDLTTMILTQELGPSLLANFLTEQVAINRQDNTSDGGKFGRRWSQLSLRVALSIFLRSSSAYEALAQSGVLKLPSESLLRSYTRARAQKAGIQHHLLSASSACYDAFAATCGPADSVPRDLETEHCEKDPPSVAFTRLPAATPFKTGLLIFDEVRIASRLMFNSASNEFVGLCDPISSYTSVSDVYSEWIDGNRTHAVVCYNLQIMWRDFTSKFFFLVAHFSSSVPFTSDRVLSILAQVMHSLQIFGFETDVIVADGASTNWTVFRTLVKQDSCATSMAVAPAPDLVLPVGFRQLVQEADDNQEVDSDVEEVDDDSDDDDDYGDVIEDWIQRPWFHNHLTGRRCFLIVDPTHLLKTSRNCLASSSLDQDGAAVLDDDGDESSQPRSMLDAIGRPVSWDHVLQTWFLDNHTAAGLTDLKDNRITAEALRLSSFSKMRVNLAMQVHVVVIPMC